MRARTGRLFLLGVLVLAGLATAATPRVENQADPRNAAGGLLNGGTVNDCIVCHVGWGMYDSHIIVPAVPGQLDIGTPRDVNLQIVNPWRADVSELTVSVALPGGPPVLVPASGRATEGATDLRQVWQGRLHHPRLVPVSPNATGPWSSTTELAFDVEPGAAAIAARLELYYPDGQAAGLNKVSAVFHQPGESATSSGYQFEPRNQDDATLRTLSLPRKEIFVVPGTWRFSLSFLDGSPDPWVDYWLNLTVAYAQGAGDRTYEVVHLSREPPEGAPVSRIPPNAALDVPVSLVGLAPGVQEVEFMVEARLWYRHSGEQPNEDTFRRYYTARIPVGDAYIPAAASGVVLGPPREAFIVVAAETTGFASAALLFPSLVLGGAYGRGSRRVLNDVLGGAKRRVMFHNVVSLGLTLTALVHIVLFFLETRYSVAMGVLWGGFGAVSLLVLGLTGYYQVPLIQRHGFAWWRAIHLAFGLLVILFVAVHAVADGPDFGFVQEQLPAWFQRLNLVEG